MQFGLRDGQRGDFRRLDQPERFSELLVRVLPAETQKHDAAFAEFFGEQLNIPRKNTTQTHLDYRSMYDDKLAEIVAQTFDRDISHFGFSFDSSATRNVFALTGALEPAATQK